MFVPTLSAVLDIVAEGGRTPRMTPGPVAGLIFLFLFASTILLWRSMNRHLRSARRTLDEPGGSDTPAS